MVVCLIVYLTERRHLKMKRLYELSDRIKSSYKALPFIGHAYMALGSNQDRMNALKKMSSEAMNSEYGVTGVWMGMNFYVVVADPVVAEVLTKLVLGKSKMKAFHDITGKYGSIFAPIAIWRSHRRIVLHSFSEKRLRMYTSIFVKQSHFALDELEPLAGIGPISLWDHMLRYAMTSVSQTLFGIDIVDLEEHELFLNAFATFLKYVAVKMCQPWFRSDIVFRSMPIYGKMEKQKRIILNFIEKAIQKKQMESPPRNANPNSVMEMLMETSRSLNQPFSLEQLRDELVVLFLASTDTSTVAVCFTCLMLAMHPQCQEKTYQEIEDALKDVPTEELSESHLAKLKYLDAMLKETLRLCPPVPIIGRKVEEDVELPNGLTVVPGCEVLISVWSIHRNPKYWGKDAEQFRPERFLETSTRPKSSFMAFAYGPRNCIGYRFAYMSTKIILISLLRRFTILPPTDQTPFELKLKFNVMLKDANNFQVQLKRRASTSK
ncbi:probable cytochrome P450 313a4 [Aricia agestis]|uniref:probable cytochrome P450 313a4 n=1 Tax=Aricia agestis TaxID=91739 RepID=UPI001C20C1C6|nr:probable cytochrome P450 313a4 [Aricia agestis]